MNDIIETIEYKDYNIEICYDTYPDNPRKAWDNLCFMACFHKKYDLGDQHTFKEPQELLDWIEANKDNIFYLPLYMYEHGNITISATPFECRFDSGQIGFIYITKEDAKMNGITKPYDLLAHEVKIYDHYLKGETYGAMIYDKKGEMIDSQFGYLGDTKEVIEEAKGMIDTYKH
jgi:hypothetical protein